MVLVGKDNLVTVLAFNLNEHVMTLTKNKTIASFQFLSPQDEEDFIKIVPDLLALDK